jgi:hypothetical protein
LRRLVIGVLFLCACIAIAEYVMVAVQIHSAQRDFINLIPEFQVHGEQSFSRRFAATLKEDGFEVSPTDIEITFDRSSGNAIIHLETQREFRVLFWQVQRSVTFHRETVFDPMRLDEQ